MTNVNDPGEVSRCVRLKLYLLSRTTKGGYDTFDSMVVAAESEEDAKNIFPEHPAFAASRSGWDPETGDALFDGQRMEWSDWELNRRDVQVREIGVADESIPRGVVLQSFNAG